MSRWLLAVVWSAAWLCVVLLKACATCADILMVSVTCPVVLVLVVSAYKPVYLFVHASVCVCSSFVSWHRHVGLCLCHSVQCACVWCRLMIAWFGVCVASCGFKPSDDGESWGYTGTCRLSHKNTCSLQSNKVKLKWTFPLIAVPWTRRSDFPLTALSSQSVTTEDKDVWFYFSNNTMKRLRQTMCFHSQPSETKNEVLNILLVSVKMTLREVKWSVLT